MLSPQPSAPPLTTAQREALALAQRIQAFWAKRNITVAIKLVQHYQVWEIVSSLRGVERCERIRIRRTMEHSS